MNAPFDPKYYDKDEFRQQSAAKKTVQTSTSSTSVWTRDKYGNVVKRSELRVGSSGYPKEFYQYHYGVSYDPRNPPSYLR